MSLSKFYTRQGTSKCFIPLVTYAVTNLFIELQYNKQHIIPLEEVKLESLADDGRKF